MKFCVKLILFVLSSVFCSTQSFINKGDMTGRFTLSEEPFKHDALQAKTILVSPYVDQINEEDDKPTVIRTATGGLINTVMIVLTIFAFLGNGAFLVYVFWLSK